MSDNKFTTTITIETDLQEDVVRQKYKMVRRLANYNAAYDALCDIYEGIILRPKLLKIFREILDNNGIIFDDIMP